LYHAFALTWTLGFPLKLNPCVGWRPIGLRMTTMASLLDGTEIAFRAVA
jgi:hypothetical protein